MPGLISSVFDLEENIMRDRIKSLAEIKRKILTQSKPESSHFSQAY